MFARVITGCHSVLQTHSLSHTHPFLSALRIAQSHILYIFAIFCFVLCDSRVKIIIFMTVFMIPGIVSLNHCHCQPLPDAGCLPAQAGLDEDRKQRTANRNSSRSCLRTREKRPLPPPPPSSSLLPHTAAYLSSGVVRSPLSSSLVTSWLTPPPWRSLATYNNNKSGQRTAQNF